MTKQASDFGTGFMESGKGADFGFATNQRTTRAVARPPGYRPFSARPTGPREFADRLNPMLAAGPGTPPPGFVRASTSGSEWVVYWAFSRIYNDPKDPRVPPFYGSSKDDTLWKYQYPYAGGRHLPGGAVVDFVSSPFNNPILIRLQTEHFHIFTDMRKHASDVLQQERLSDYGVVIDLYDQDFMDDPSGASCIIQVKRAIQGILPIDVLLTGTAKRIQVPHPGGRHK
jgi:hypothetical protein